MKRLFLLGILGFAVVFGIAYFLYRIVLALAEVVDDWRLAKELREIEEESAKRRAEKQRSETEGL